MLMNLVITAPPVLMDGFNYEESHDELVLDARFRIEDHELNLNNRIELGIDSQTTISIEEEVGSEILRLIN